MASDQEDLFAEQRAGRRTEVAPLAARMRPASLDEVLGQEHLTGAGAAFRSIVESGEPVSLILWGPPGTGKTSLARLIAAGSRARFEQLSATSAGVKDVREVLASAAQRIEDGRGRTVLFLDEIHRFTKAQQDALLPGVEEGLVTLVGATTENPFFEVNSPLISRATMFRTELLQPGDVEQVVERAVADPMRGLRGVGIDDDAVIALSVRVGGDARLALNALEVAARITEGRAAKTISLNDVTEALQRRVIRYDKAADRHYDVVSAFIKSMRGSDPDASLYWLHTMLEAGEDPKFVARRMIILASEDVGLADPDALAVAVDAFRALEVHRAPRSRLCPQPGHGLPSDRAQIELDERCDIASARGDRGDAFGTSPTPSAVGRPRRSKGVGRWCRLRLSPRHRRQDRRPAVPSRRRRALDSVCTSDIG